MATTEGTWRYRDRFCDAFGRTGFRQFGPGVVSSLGIGTYLGEPTDAVDDSYREAIVTALENGVNVVDTAINYRCQRSEHAVGRAIRESDADREEVLVATKGGFVPFDGSRPDDPGAYVRQEFVETGLASQEDLAMGSHCIVPSFLDAMIDRSLDNLGLDHLDLHYVHNPETQLAARSRAAVYDQLEAAFRLLERRRIAGDVGSYGVATWDAFRVPQGHERYLSLPEVISRAASAADAVGVADHGFDGHGLAAIQLPFNVHMADAFTERVHLVDGVEKSALECAREAGLGAFTSASIGQGELTTEGAIPPDVDARLAGDSPIQRAINFARSAPGVTCSLVGMSRPEHVRENVAACTFDPLGARAFDETFE
ncbi:Aryl-alcohol dehydrogenase related enzyme [Halalkaliarchaeum sp. AArc-CO]|uniref:aldo/keto reductase n=1 Tax=unclassified Halalkaliarchaeum TaxID=2678344 RepID=UPI00217E7B38|nr:MULTISPECIES: aldo/keto reductase [unclassified Halalkaliarchaeum]MDR5672658.1 aldo/keto reductase [Halalkaliarchaeum sp. AArc-GB]UWG49437.1 Aryl-alcohol dehydrogenase related enzyme [Halalkaliarchaeum sp. AArc-CO]